MAFAALHPDGTEAVPFPPMSAGEAVDLLLLIEDFDGRKYVNEYLAGPDHDFHASRPWLVAEIREAVRDHDAAMAALVVP